MRYLSIICILFSSLSQAIEIPLDTLSAGQSTGTHALRLHDLPGDPTHCFDVPELNKVIIFLQTLSNGRDVWDFHKKTSEYKRNMSSLLIMFRTDTDHHDVDCDVLP